MNGVVRIRRCSPKSRLSCIGQFAWRGRREKHERSGTGGDHCWRIAARTQQARLVKRESCQNEANAQDRPEGRIKGSNKKRNHGLLRANPGASQDVFEEADQRKRRPSLNKRCTAPCACRRIRSCKPWQARGRASASLRSSSRPSNTDLANEQRHCRRSVRLLSRSFADDQGHGSPPSAWENHLPSERLIPDIGRNDILVFCHQFVPVTGQFDLFRHETVLNPADASQQRHPSARTPGNHNHEALRIDGRRWL